MSFKFGHIYHAFMEPRFYVTSPLPDYEVVDPRGLVPATI
jgi:hypothetical protein